MMRSRRDKPTHKRGSLSLLSPSGLNWSRKVHFAQWWLGRHSISTWFHQIWWPENFTLLALWRTITNAPSIIPYPMGGQIFKVIFFAILIADTDSLQKTKWWILVKIEYQPIHDSAKCIFLDYGCRWPTDCWHPYWVLLGLVLILFVIQQNTWKR